MTASPTVLKHFRLIGRFDQAQEILQEVQSQPDLFDVDASRQQRVQVQRETRSIPVRTKQRRTDLPEQRDRDVLGSQWTPWADRLPRLRAFLEHIAEQQDALLGRVRVVNLPAGQRVYPHVDRGNYYRQLDRHHLVLRSTDGSWLKSGDEEVRMRAGELWWFDNLQLHEAMNDGEHDRLHVIFDLLPRAKAHLLQPPAQPVALRSLGVRPTLAPGVHKVQLPGCLPCQLIVPSHTGDPVPLLALHGMTRDVDAQVQALSERAQALGRWVVVPLFSAQAHPQYRLARCPQQSDAALLRTLRELAHFGVDTRLVDLAGFSAGAQFAHRFAMLYPNRVRRLVLSAAGWYTLPDAPRSHAFPVGLAGHDLRAKVMHANLKAYVGLPITVVVGEQDNTPDGTTRRDPSLDALQGTDRVERARRYVAAVVAAGEQLGQRTNTRLEVLPGAGHDFSACAGRGLVRLMLPAMAQAGSQGVAPVRSADQPRREAQAA